MEKSGAKWRMRRDVFPQLFLCFLALALSGLGTRGAVILAPPQITSTQGGVEIRWRTDVPTGSRVQYGRSASALTQRADGEVGTNHLVALSGLTPGEEYHFTVGTARVPLATNVLIAPGGTRKAKAGETNRTTSASARASAASTPSRAPPTRETWGTMASLPDHFSRHGADFNAKDADDYARLAWEFLQRARSEGLPMKVDEDGVLRVFDPKTRAFASYNRDGKTKTFFKARSRDYFERQPGRLLTPRR